MLEAKWAEGKFVCVGLDPDWEKIPRCVVEVESQDVTFERNPLEQRVLVRFCCRIVDQTKDLVCAYKPNAAFFESHGSSGRDALVEIIRYIHQEAPDVPVIYDAKRADIGNTNKGYVQDAFGNLTADAITVNPYFGGEAIQPFLDQIDKGIIVLCRTSNPGSNEFQRVDVIGDDVPGGYMEMYEYVAHLVSTHWNRNNNCALVVGATFPEELAVVRKRVGDMPILIPGVGAQGGKPEDIVPVAKDSCGVGFVINASRSIIHASSTEDFAEAARRETIKLHEEINKYR